MTKKEKIELLEKKVQNLHKTLTIKDEKLKFQKIEITNLLEQKEDLKSKLNNANSVVGSQIEGFNTMCSTYESQLALQDKAINRLNIIINYLEEKNLKIYE